MLAGQRSAAFSQAAPRLSAGRAPSGAQHADSGRRPLAGSQEAGPPAGKVVLHQPLSCPGVSRSICRSEDADPRRQGAYRRRSEILRQALEVLTRIAHIDLVVTDQAMPNMTRLQLAKLIKESWPALPIIIATGSAEMPNGGTDVPKITKPYFEGSGQSNPSGIADRASCLHKDRCTRDRITAPKPSHESQ